MTLDDIKAFRQLDSACPGHPEYHLTSGVEATTGPLGQGVAMSVGLAIAERWLGASLQSSRLRRGGLAHLRAVRRRLHDGGDFGEAASLAGHLKLNKLCWIYDFEPGDDRRPHRDRLYRGRRDALPRTWLERAACARRQ